jgi:hypothetical protein
MSAVRSALINDPWPLYYNEFFAGRPIGLLGNSALKKAPQVNLEKGAVGFQPCIRLFQIDRYFSFYDQEGTR